MFRELVRKKKQLPMAECLRILREEKRGVLSVLGDDGYPYGMPMNHWYEAENGKIYFHCGRGGHRADAIARCDKVSFCVYETLPPEEGKWALFVRSVIVFGRVAVVEDTLRVREIAERLSHKFTVDEEYIRAEIAVHAKRTILLELTPEHISGKWVEEA